MCCIYRLGLPCKNTYRYVRLDRRACTAVALQRGTSICYAALVTPHATVHIQREFSSRRRSIYTPRCPQRRCGCQQQTGEINERQGQRLEAKHRGETAFRTRPVFLHAAYTTQQAALGKIQSARAVSPFIIVVRRGNRAARSTSSSGLIHCASCNLNFELSDQQDQQNTGTRLVSVHMHLAVWLFAVDHSSQFRWTA